MDEKLFKEMMGEFYSGLLQDEHASSFISSVTMLDELINRQYKVVDKLFKNHCKTEDIVKIAKRHKEIGIHYHAMFDSIEMFFKLVKEYKMLDEEKIEEYKKRFEDVTAKEYIKSIVNELDRFLKLEGTRELSKYDEFVYKEIVKHLELILDIIEKKQTNIDFLFHTSCKLGKFLNGIAFKIISFENEEIALKIKTIHKSVHVLFKDLIAYMNNKEYKQAVATVVEISENIYKLLNEYRLLSLNWNKKEDEIIASFASSSRSKDNIYSLIINIQANEKILEFLNNKLCGILDEFFEDFEFVFFNRCENSVKIFLNKKCPNFNHKHENLFNKITELAKEIDKNYSAIVSTPVLYVATLDISRLNYLDRYEIKEVFRVIKKDLIKSKTDSFILVKNYDEEFSNLLNKARESYLIRKASRDAVLNKTIELFGHFMFDLNEEKVAVEILSRIKRDNEYIPAFKFIDVLQEEKLMEKLDYVVLSKLAESVDYIKASGVKRIFVNVYPPSLMDSDVIGALKSVIDIFSKHGLTLYLELTEYAILPDCDVLNLLNAKKFKIAFDDFGSGSTNYELIGEMAHRENAEVIKIDGEIVKNIISSDIYRSIFRSISMFANSINMLLVYEYVETEELVGRIKKIAKEFKIDAKNAFIQGFYYHKPESILNFIK